MTWTTYREPPAEVGEYQLNDVFGHTMKVQWDGKNFRYAEGPYIGGVVSHYKGDLWAPIQGEKS